MLQCTNLWELDHDTAVEAGDVLDAELDKPYQRQVRAPTEAPDSS